MGTMKSIFFALFAAVLSVKTLPAQDRQLELDSLIERASSLPKGIEKAQVLARIHERMMFMDNERALVFARRSFELSQEIDYGKGIANGYLQFGNYYYNQTKNDTALYYHSKALEQFSELGSIRGQIFALHSMASIEKDRGNYGRGIELIQSILQLYSPENRENSDLGTYDSKGSEYELLGGIYFEKGSYQLALEHTLTAVKLFEEQGDEVRKGDALKQLADIEYQLGNFTSSLSYAQEASEIYERHGDKIYSSYAGNTAGLAAERLGRIGKAEEFFDRSLELAREINIQGMIAANLKDLARLNYLREDFAQSRVLLEESIEISRREDVKLGLTAGLQEMANLLIEQGNYSQALPYIEEVIETAREIGALPALSDALKTRSVILSRLNLHQRAYEDYAEYHLLTDSIYDLRKNQQIEELKTIYETEQKEAEIALQKQEINTLNEKAKVDRLSRGLFAGGMFTFVAVSGLLYFGFTQRIRKNRIEREKQEELYRKEIEFKQKELASQTLHLVQKNTFIQELLNNLEGIKDSPEKFRIEFRRIVMLLKKENASDKDWEIFKTYFSEVHNDFDQKLKTLYPDISEKEIRLAAFLRMNLTTKEIAATLNVLPDSILKSKYRLKKKLGLDRETDLSSFLNTI